MPIQSDRTGPMKASRFRRLALGLGGQLGVCSFEAVWFQARRTCHQTWVRERERELLAVSQAERFSKRLNALLIKQFN